MKKGKVVVYILGLIGLYIALLCFYVLWYYYTADTTSLVFIAVYGVLFFFGNKALCSHCLESLTATKIAYVAAFVLLALHFVLFNKSGFIFTFVSWAVMLDPIIHRQKQLKQESLDQTPCTCSFCGHINEPDAVFCTECGSGLMHNQEPVKQDAKKTDPTPQKSSDQKVFNVWMVLLPLALCIFTAYLCFRFFFIALPDREILTDLVRLTNNLTGEELYTNVIIIPDESGEYYCVKGMVNPLTGLKDSVESNWESFGSESRLISSIGFRSSYSVTIDYRDLQVSFLEKLESHPIGFVLCFGSFVVSVLLLFFMVRQEKHRMKS